MPYFMKFDKLQGDTTDTTDRKRLGWIEFISFNLDPGPSGRLKDAKDFSVSKEGKAGNAVDELYRRGEGANLGNARLEAVNSKGAILYQYNFTRVKRLHMQYHFRGYPLPEGAPAVHAIWFEFETMTLGPSSSSPTALTPADVDRINEVRHAALRVTN
jgi:hypothetical protein